MLALSFPRAKGREHARTTPGPLLNLEAARQSHGYSAGKRIGSLEAVLRVS
jgi:hypothetical protein